MIYRDRTEAGEMLAAKLAGRVLVDPLMLAIPRGGVVVGAAIADALGAELDVVLARKLRSPGQRELALGAVAEDGSIWLDPRLGDLDPSTREFVQHEARTELEEIRRRVQLFRSGRTAAPVSGRSVILVDDGIATGSTALAAIHTLREWKPREIILAVPIMPPERMHEFERLCDGVITLQTPEDFWAIGQFYRDFRQIEDEEVVALLARSRRSGTAPEP